jgi:LPS sulfotransferase NodH
MARNAVMPVFNPDRRRPETQARVADIMSARSDLPEATPAHRFLFVAEPRSGGSLLAEALRSSGQAGVPYEYLNPRLIEAFAARFGRSETAPTEDYIGYLLRHRTTPNGVFVFKALAEQVSPHLKGKGLLGRFFENFEKLIVLYRRDKLAQAVSYYKASVSDAWNSQDRFDGYDDPARFPFDPVAISQFLRALFAFERQLASIVDWAKARGMPVAVFDYESLDADFGPVWGRLVAFLDLPAIPAASVHTTLQRQRDAVSERLIAQYLARLRNSDRVARRLEKRGP